MNKKNIKVFSIIISSIILTSACGLKMEPQSKNTTQITTSSQSNNKENSNEATSTNLDNNQNLVGNVNENDLVDVINKEKEAMFNLASYEINSTAKVTYSDTNDSANKNSQTSQTSKIIKSSKKIHTTTKRSEVETQSFIIDSVNYINDSTSWSKRKLSNEELSSLFPSNVEKITKFPNFENITLIKLPDGGYEIKTVKPIKATDFYAIFVGSKNAPNASSEETIEFTFILDKDYTDNSLNYVITNPNAKMKVETESKVSKKNAVEDFNVPQEAINAPLSE